MGSRLENDQITYPCRLTTHVSHRISASCRNVLDTRQTYRKQWKFTWWCKFFILSPGCFENVWLVYREQKVCQKISLDLSYPQCLHGGFASTSIAFYISINLSVFPLVFLTYFFMVFRDDLKLCSFMMRNYKTSLTFMFDQHMLKKFACKIQI